MLPTIVKYMSPYFVLIVLLIYNKHAISQETLLVLQNNMTATHTTAKGDTKGAVLLIHGWASNMDEVGNLYKRLAEQLSVQGFASLRINIRGESEGHANNHTLTSTFASRVNDAQTGLKFLQKTYPHSSIGVVGFSLGGSTAIALAGLHPKQINSIVLWSSGGNPSDVAANLLTSKQQQTIMNEGSIVVNSWVALTITKQHLLGLQGPDIFTPFTAYTGAILCIRGTKDTIPDIDRKVIDTAAGSIKEYRHIAGADHIFDVLNPSTHFDKRVLAQSVTWFTETL